MPGGRICYVWRVRSSTSALALSGLLSGLVLTSAAARAQACACPGAPSPAELVPATSFAAADAVFEGRVREVSTEGDGLRVTFEVVQHWKGMEAERAVVQTRSAACGVPFTEETSWLVYARRAGHAWTTDLCAGTRRVEDASAALAELGAGVVPVDITEDDEVERPAERDRPQRAGCASCTVGAGELGGGGGVGILLVLATTWIRRRRRSAGQLL
jgi:hypothetical protein